MSMLHVVTKHCLVEAYLNRWVNVS